MNAKNSTIRKGDIVRVKREKKIPYSTKVDPLTIETQPTIGRVVFVHPLGIFYVVEFRDRYTAEYMENRENTCRNAEWLWNEVLTRADCKQCIHKVACAIYADKRSDVILRGYDREGYKETSKKPTIRHCKNCKWVQNAVFTDSVTCTVKYKWILNDYQRITALLCKHYCKKDGADNA